MKIELRKISYNAALSEETSAYAAQIWVDGVHICDVSNHGTGGPDEHHPAKGKTHRDIEKLEAAIKAEGKTQTYHGTTLDEDLELICGDLLQDHLIAKDLQRTLKRTIAYFDPEKKAIFTFKKIPDHQRAPIIAGILQRKPKAIILNNLAFAEALRVFKLAS